MAGLSRRDAERRQANQKLSASYWQQPTDLGRPRDYLAYLKEWAEDKPRFKVVLYLRVSGRTQRKNDNLRGQEANCRRAIHLLGGEVIKVFTAPGYSGYLRPGCPATDTLRVAAAYARKHGAILVAESLSRFVRHEDYREDNQLQANQQALERLKEVTDGCQLGTVLAPDATVEEERSLQTKRGQEDKNKKGGRPRNGSPGIKKKLRNKWLPEVLRLRSLGWGYARIAKATRRPVTTVRRWLNRAKRGVYRF